ncbi:BolA family protein [Pararhodobacter oceanensis]|uniref:BolA family protein n=1 Tax=Pararhodobacter oceanensis TaxID=2172121 RepID=UPI003A8E2F11
MSDDIRISDQIEARLRAAFTPEALSVEDESESHRGHAGWRDGGQTHFHVALQAPELKGLSRLARHRAVHAALGAELIARIHALRLTLS